MSSPPDFSMITAMDDFDHSRQIALRIHPNASGINNKNKTSNNNTTSATATSAASAAAGGAEGEGEETATATSSVTIDPNTTTFVLPRAQAVAQMGLVNRALKLPACGDLVEIALQDPSRADSAQLTMRGIRLCIEFLGIHASSSQFPQIPKPLKLHLQDYLQGPDKEFVYQTLILNADTPEQENDALFECMTAAHALEFRPLIELCSAALAQIMTGKTVSQIRDLLGVESDYTIEEEKEISDANKKMFPEEARRF